MIQLKGKDKILFSINESVNEFEKFYNECKKHNFWNEKELYFKLGTTILWIGVWINKIQEIEKNNDKKHQILNEKERKLKNAFLCAYNAHKHSIAFVEISQETTALRPRPGLHPRPGLYPSAFSCKWIKLNKGDIENDYQLEAYNELLSGKEVLDTIIEMNNIIKNIEL